MNEADKKELAKVEFLDLFVSFVALYAVVLLVVGSCFDLLPEVRRMFRWLDSAMCGLFIFDFVKRWICADDRIRFWRWGWLDVLACIPFVPWLRWCRAVRLLHIMLMVRAGKDVKVVHSHFLKDRRVGAAAVSFYIFYSMVLVCAPAILITESASPTANIHAAGDAVWWVFETMSTVGYGDFFPVTIAGRIVGAATMVLGVAMFGAMTATVLANFGIGQETPHKEDDLQALRRENEELKARLATPTDKKTGESGTRNDCNLA